MNAPTISLATRTDFSVGESSLQVKKLVAAAKEQGLTHVAIADLMTVSAVPMFFEAAKKAGITPIAGVTIKVVTDPTGKVKDRENGAFRLRAYPKNDSGMQRLFALLSKGMSKDNFYYSARVGLEDVLALGEDVVLTTGDLHSLWRLPNADQIMERLDLEFAGDLYVELSAIDTPLFDRLNKIAAAQASKRDLRVVVTRPAFYVPGEDDATDVLRAITSNTPVNSIFLARPWVRDMTLLTPAEFDQHASVLFAKLDLPTWRQTEAYESIQEIARSTAGYKCEKQPPSLPKMATDEFAQLVKEVRAGWASRFSRPVWGHKPDATQLPAYQERLKEELAMLKRLNFSGYFLLVQEIVQWSKDNGVRVGPGRGSVGGSLVAYLLGITDIDPIRFGLLFERFISPDRVDLPDADLDFMSGKRHMVVDYITRRFGEANVCGIVNFSTLGAASALRDTARLYGLEAWEYACSKQMEKEHGVALSLEESAAVVPDIEKFKTAHPIIWENATKLEGANRSLSQHAAGVVVAGEPVVNRGVISTRGEHPVVQWDKTWVEHFGLIKMDILGLTTLDLVDLALRYIKERHHKDVDLLSIPLDDERVLDAFGQGKTTGVFQFDGGGMKKLLKEMAMGGRLTFDDICAATALFRPGPLDAGLCDRYVQIKQGNMAPYYDHPSLKPVLEKTHGVLVYQEQVMQAVQALAGFRPAEADGVRKAMGKKDAAKMATYKEKFVKGAVAGTVKVELEDGRVLIVNAAKKFKCKDGVERTVSEALRDSAEIVDWN